MCAVEGDVLVEAGPAGLGDLDHAVAILADHAQPTGGAIGSRPGEHGDAWLAYPMPWAFARDWRAENAAGSAERSLPGRMTE